MSEAERNAVSKIPNLSAGTRIVEAFGGGDCLYESLDERASKRATRENIAKYIRDGPSLLFHGFTYSEVIEAADLHRAPMSLEEYYTLMAHSKVYGGDIEIDAHCKMQKCRVVVYILDTDSKYKVNPVFCAKLEIIYNAQIY
jgi:hypothetical protein